MSSWLIVFSVNKSKNHPCIFSSHANLPRQFGTLVARASSHEMNTTSIPTKVSADFRTAQAECPSDDQWSVSLNMAFLVDEI